MIVSAETLGDLRGQVTMVDGGFDPLHDGHIEYFVAASELGMPLLCNVTGDDWVSRKHPVLLPQDRRVRVIDAIRHITYTHPSRLTTAEVLERLVPRYYAKGADWRGRLPDEELTICAAQGTEVIYLDTVSYSSTAMLAAFRRA